MENKKSIKQELKTALEILTLEGIKGYVNTVSAQDRDFKIYLINNLIKTYNEAKTNVDWLEEPELKSDVCG